MEQTPEELARKIRDAQARQAQQNHAADTDARHAARFMAAQAMRAATDLIAGTGVGAFLGYWLDRWLGTLPLFMVILFFLGMAAGMVNLYRSQTGQTLKTGFRDLDTTRHNAKEED